MLIPGTVPKAQSMGHYNWPRLDQMPTFGAERQFVCDFGNVCTCVYMCVGKAEKKKIGSYYYRYAQWKDLGI